MFTAKRNKVFNLFVTVFALLIFQQLCSQIGGSIANQFSYHWFDRQNVFAWISVHHMAQMFFAITAIILLKKIRKIEFGFCIGNVRIGLKYIFTFSAIILSYVLISYSVGYALHIISPYPYTLNVKNICGSLAFQLLLSGPSEEILFRALPIMVFISIMGVSKPVKVLKWHTSVETIIAAVLFSIAHISWSITSFSMSADYVQLIYAFVLGLAYGNAYQKSKSIIYPMVMHSISNFLMLSIGYIIEVI